MEKYNPNLAYYKDSIDAQYWALIASNRQWYPTVTVNNGSTPTFNYSSQSSSSQSTPRTSPESTVETTSYSKSVVIGPGIAVQWAFFDPTRGPEIKTNQELLKNQQYLYIIALRNQILSVQTSYFQVQAAWDLVKAYTQLYEINLKQLDIVEERYKNRLVDKGSLGQTRAQLYIVLTQLINYYTQYLTAFANLTQAIGLTDDKLVIPDSPLRVLGNWKISEKETLESALQNREEIKGYLAQASAAKWQSQAFLRSYLPILSIYSNSYLNNSYRGSSNQAVSYSASNRSSSVGVNVEWNVFDGGINLANAQSRKASSRAFTSQAEIERLAVTQQVRSSFSTYQTASQAVQASQKGMDSANSAQSVARVRFQYGVGNITTVVQALQLYGQASQQNIQAILDYNNSLVSLYRYSSLQPETVYASMPKITMAN